MLHKVLEWFAPTLDDAFLEIAFTFNYGIKWLDAGQYSGGNLIINDARLPVSLLMLSNNKSTFIIRNGGIYSLILA